MKMENEMQEEVQTSFTWEELSDKAKDRARQGFEPDGRWWSDVYTQYIGEGVAKGFNINHIYFSGFWSQGDGASWAGYIDIVDYVTYHWADAPVRQEMMHALLASGDMFSRHNATVRTSGRYNHEYTMHLEEVGKDDTEGSDGVNCPGSPFHGACVDTVWEALGYTDPALHDLNEELLEAARDYAREIYKALEAEYEHQTSDEYLADMCEANEYRFDEDGHLI